MTSKNKQNIFKNYGEQNNNSDFNSQSIDAKINEIEKRIRGLYETKIPQNLNINRQQVESDLSLKQKLDSFKDDLKRLSDNIKSTVQDSEKTIDSNTQSVFSEATSSIYSTSEKKEDISDAINEIQDKISKLSAIADKMSDGNVQTQEQVKNDKIDAKDKVEKTMNNLDTLDEQIKSIKDGLSNLYTQPQVTGPVVEKKTEIKVESTHTDNNLADQVKSPLLEKEVISKKEVRQTTPHGPITLRPKQKKEGLFNDANLTEDYELGFRFHELGFKTGFFNVMLDEDDDASRIATAEFFPNTFWAAVKQRSRWVAGIVFQNSKSHHWSGNLTTKYFLFRDRKSVLSFFGAFLSNIVLFYLIFAVLSNLFQWTHVNSLVAHSSVLWLLMIANLVFMISRLSHRFIFTYNWYGFRYAFFSIFRLPVDTVVNFFAIARSISVYKNTKSKAKVVWDSTTHY